jgi:hypothetical protein
VGSTSESWDASISAQETFTAPPTCVRSDNHSIFLRTDDNNSGQVGMQYTKSCRRYCSLSDITRPIPGSNGFSVSRYHTPRAVRESGYFNTRHLGTAAIIISGPWHRALARRSNPLNRAIHCASSSCPGVNTLVHLQVGELLSPFASPFRLVICINPASLSYLPYQNSPLRFAYSVQEQDSKPTGRSSPSPLAANIYTLTYYGHAFTTP